MNYSLYCFEEEQALCLGCNSVEAATDEAAGYGIKKKQKSAHDGHFIKSISVILEQAEKDKNRLKEEMREQE